MQLDFSALTDDQLVELIRQAVDEAARRGAATASAARAIGLDASERLRIQKAAAEAEAARLRAYEEELAREQARNEARRHAQAQEWRRRAELARPFFEALGEGFTLNVWARGADKRVYVERRATATKLCYYATGNSHNPPGSIETVGFMSNLYHDRRLSEDELAALKKRLHPALEAAAREPAGFRLELDKAIAFLNEEQAS